MISRMRCVGVFYFILLCCVLWYCLVVLCYDVFYGIVWC